MRSLGSNFCIVVCSFASILNMAYGQDSPPVSWALSYGAGLWQGGGGIGRVLLGLLIHPRWVGCLASRSDSLGGQQGQLGRSEGSGRGVTSSGRHMQGKASVPADNMI